MLKPYTKYMKEHRTRFFRYQNGFRTITAILKSYLFRKYNMTLLLTVTFVTFEIQIFLQ